MSEENEHENEEQKEKKRSELKANREHQINKIDDLLHKMKAQRQRNWENRGGRDDDRDGW